MRLKRFLEHKSGPSLAEIKDYLSDLIDEYSCEIIKGTDMTNHEEVELLEDDIARLSVLLKIDPKNVFSFKVRTFSPPTTSTEDFRDRFNPITKYINGILPLIESVFNIKYITRSCFSRMPIRGMSHPGVITWEFFFRVNH